MKKYFIAAFLIYCGIAPLGCNADDIIRLYQESDRKVISRLEKCVCPFRPMSYDEMRARYEIKLYFKNDYMIGVIVYDKKAYQSSLRIDITKKHTPYQEFKCGEIAFLTVRDEYHRQGVGTALLQEALNDMKKNGIEVAQMYTFVNDIAARSLFEKNGFSLAMPVEDRARLCYYHMPLDLSVWPY